MKQIIRFGLLVLVVAILIGNYDAIKAGLGLGGGFLSGSSGGSGGSGGGGAF